MKRIFSILLCAVLVFSLISCAKENGGNDVSSALTQSESQASSQMENSETSSKKDKTSSKDKESSSKKEEGSSSSKKNSARPNDTDDSSKTSSKDIAEETNVITSFMKLWSADVNVGDIIELNVEPYAKGEYKIVKGEYTGDDALAIDMGSGKFAVRYFKEHNAWKKNVPSGSYVAHKGFNGYTDSSERTSAVYPANTLEAVKHAVRLGFKMIEIDITVTKDGVWVLNHDGNDNELSNTGGGVPLASLNWSDIKSGYISRQWITGGWYNFSSALKKEYITTLDDVLAYLKTTDTIAILDCKFLDNHKFTDAEMDKLAALIEKHGVEEQCGAYAACNSPLILRVPEIISVFTDVPNKGSEEKTKNYLSTLKNYMISISSSAYKDAVAGAKKYNIPLAVWTCDDYKTAQEIFKNGADFVLTNCLVNNPDFKDYETVKTYSFTDLASVGTANSATIGGNSVSVKSGGSVSFPISYSQLGLKVGDIIELNAKSSTAKGLLRIETVGAPALRKAEIVADGKATLYYIVNDNYAYDLSLILKSDDGSAVDFSDISVRILRDKIR